MIARIYFIILFFFILSCKENYTPKPRAFFKIDLPNKKYKIVESNCGFTFKIPHYSFLEKLNRDCFYNVVFPNQNATLHITYFKLESNLLIQQSKKWLDEANYNKFNQLISSFVNSISKHGNVVSSSLIVLGPINANDGKDWLIVQLAAIL